MLFVVILYYVSLQGCLGVSPWCPTEMTRSCGTPTVLPRLEGQGLILEHLALRAFVHAVWLGNRVEAMEFPGRFQTEEDITDSYISDSNLVAFFINIVSVTTALCIS